MLIFSSLRGGYSATKYWVSVSTTFFFETGRSRRLGMSAVVAAATAAAVTSGPTGQ
jgi:hypothetical protein